MTAHRGQLACDDSDGVAGPAGRVAPRAPAAGGLCDPGQGLAELLGARVQDGAAVRLPLRLQAAPLGLRGVVDREGRGRLPAEGRGLLGRDDLAEERDDPVELGCVTAAVALGLVAADGLHQGVRVLLVQGTNRAFYSAILSSRYRRAVWSGGYSRTPGGGNGLALLSIADTGSFNLSYSADKKLSFGLTTSVNRIQSLSNDVGGAFTTYFSGGSANYFFTRSLGFNTTILFRHQDLPIATNLRNSYRVAFGLTWSPGEVGLPVF